MPRAKKDGHFLSCYVLKEVYDALTEYSESTMIPKTSLLEKALMEFFENHPLSKPTQDKDG